MRKFLSVMLAVVMLLMVVIPVACNRNEDDNNNNNDCEHNYVGGFCTKCGDPEPACEHNFVGGFCTKCGDPEPGLGDIGGDGDDGTFTYYKPTKLRSDKKIYAINMDGGLSNDKINTASALQGLFARKEVTFYVDGRYMSNGVNTDQYHLNTAVENYGLDVENISLEQAIGMYKNAWSDMVAAGIWGSNISLDDGFNYNNRISAVTDVDGQGYATPGYIVYDPATISVNIASTLAGITGFLPVSYDETEQFDDWGLVEKMDVTSDSMFTYKWCFDACISELSKDGLIHQNYKQNTSTNYYVRDYGVMNKFFHAYYDDSLTINETLKDRIHSHLNKNVAILGYAYSEDRDVALFSKYGHFIVPTDYSMNVSFHVAKDFRQADGFTQPNNDRDVAAEQGKHYVAFVVSDGDNAQYWQNTAIFSSSYMNATGRANDSFPVTWSISPSLTDLMPLVLQAAYGSSYTTQNDYFCAPVSGQGYINAGNFYNAGAEYMTNFLSNLDIYLQRSDLNVTTIIGAADYKGTGGIYGTLNAYAQVPSLKGAIVLDGERYFGGSYPGGVYWQNGKPFMVPRDSLWTTTPAYVAARINRYAASATGSDITNSDAYTVINVHPWSHNYTDLRKIVGMLSDNVEVVSVDRLVNMMIDNVADKSDSASFKVPALNGKSITDSMLQQDPSSIPVDPYFNDFLLYEEDWTGSSIAHHSTDAAAGEAYGGFQTNLEIRSSATKKAFNLPSEDDVWITFYARANSTSPLEVAKFRMDMTVDGNTKTVIAEAQLNGVTGTKSANVVGNGWQTFTFPIAQYFENYKGKVATVTIAVSSATSIKIDQFTVKSRPLNAGPATGGDYYSNEFENGSTEDWLLGDVFETSQYHSWGAVSHKNNKPEGKIDVDASDGGGNEKRNANVNVWFAKVITLKGNDSLTFYVDGDADKAERSALSKLSMYVDGKLIVIYDWQESHTVGEKTYDLQELAGVSLEGKQVTFVFEVRDSCKDNGAGQDFYLDYFRLTQA